MRAGRVVKDGGSEIRHEREVDEDVGVGFLRDVKRRFEEDAAAIGDLDLYTLYTR